MEVARSRIFPRPAALLLAAALAASCGGDEESPIAPREPLIQLWPSSLEFIAIEGGTDPELLTVTVTNAGGGALTGLEASTASDWMILELTGTTDPATVRVRAVTEGLASGLYEGAIRVGSRAAENSPRIVDVQLDLLEPAPRIAASATELSFDAPLEGKDPGWELIRVTNGGTGTLTDLALDVSYVDGDGWLLPFLSSAEAPAWLDVTVDPDGLPTGTYSAMIILMSPVAVNSPVEISVVLGVPDVT